MFGFFKKNNTITIDIKPNIELTQKDIQKLNEREKETNLWKQNNEKYKTYVTRHYEILEKIQFDLYSKAINEKSIFNKYSEECIKLGYEDLSLAPYIIEWQIQDAKIRHIEYIPLNYGSHKYMIKLLEKQKKYDEAIDVCDKYIKLGLTDDGTKNGIIGRKDKIVKKRSMLV